MLGIWGSTPLGTFRMLGRLHLRISEWSSWSEEVGIFIFSLPSWMMATPCTLAPGNSHLSYAGCCYPHILRRRVWECEQGSDICWGLLKKSWASKAHTNKRFVSPSNTRLQLIASNGCFFLTWGLGQGSGHLCVCVVTFHSHHPCTWVTDVVISRTSLLPGQLYT